MVVIFYGTSAELIKLLGIVKRIPRSQMLLICTAQHREGLKKLHPQLGVEPDIYLSYGWKDKDVTNIKQMLGMMLKAHGRFFAQYRAIKKRIKESDKKHNTKSIAMVDPIQPITIAPVGGVPKSESLYIANLMAR